jgi:monovalent cation:H+ antiporter, CPA1 family
LASHNSLKIELWHIRTDIVPLLLLANLGVSVATLMTELIV